MFDLYLFQFLYNLYLHLLLFYYILPLIHMPFQACLTSLHDLLLIQSLLLHHQILSILLDLLQQLHLDLIRKFLFCLLLLKICYLALIPQLNTSFHLILPHVLFLFLLLHHLVNLLQLMLLLLLFQLLHLVHHKQFEVFYLLHLPYIHVNGLNLDVLHMFLFVLLLNLLHL